MVTLCNTFRPGSLRAQEGSGPLFLLNWTTGTGANAVELELAGPAYISASYLSVMLRLSHQFHSFT